MNGRKYERCNKIGHSFVVDTSFVNLGSCRRCGMIKTRSGDWVE